MEYSEYVGLMKRQIETNDARERVYQDNIIRPFLQSVFQDLDIEPVDIKINSEKHDYEQYCGKNNKAIPITPDLCITDKWYWNNRENNVNYKGVVEIKSPILDYITGLEPSKYKCKNEIQQHLNAKNNTKVILTDGVTWTFYNKEKDLTPVIDPICLGELVYRYKISKYNELIAERTPGRKRIVENINFMEEKNFDRLKDELIKFIKEEI